MVKRYTLPSDGASGPTRSTCTSANLAAEAGNAVRVARLCRWTLDDWQSAHERTQLVMSELMLGHTKRAWISLRVALTPGCASEWKTSKTLRATDAGTTGRSVGPRVSTMMGWLGRLTSAAAPSWRNPMSRTTK